MQVGKVHMGSSVSGKDLCMALGIELPDPPMSFISSLSYLVIWSAFMQIPPGLGFCALLLFYMKFTEKYSLPALQDESLTPEIPL